MCSGLNNPAQPFDLTEPAGAAAAADTTATTSTSSTTTTKLGSNSGGDMTARLCAQLQPASATAAHMALAARATNAAAERLVTPPQVRKRKLPADVTNAATAPGLDKGSKMEAEGEAGCATPDLISSDEQSDEPSPNPSPPQPDSAEKREIQQNQQLTSFVEERDVIVMPPAKKAKRASAAGEKPWNKVSQSKHAPKPWTTREDQMLLLAQPHLGNQWTELSRIITTRSPASIKNRWNNKRLQSDIRSKASWTQSIPDDIRTLVKDGCDKAMAAKKAAPSKAKAIKQEVVVKKEERKFTYREIQPEPTVSAPLLLYDPSLLARRRRMRRAVRLPASTTGTMAKIPGSVPSSIMAKLPSTLSLVPTKLPPPALSSVTTTKPPPPPPPPPPPTAPSSFVFDRKEIKTEPTPQQLRRKASHFPGIAQIVRRPKNYSPPTTLLHSACTAASTYFPPAVPAAPRRHPHSRVGRLEFSPSNSVGSADHAWGMDLEEAAGTPFDAHFVSSSDATEAGGSDDVVFVGTN